MYELEFLLASINYTYREQYEMMRFNSYITAQTQSTKKLKPTDIISFSWDKENEEKVTTISNEDINRLREKAERMSELLK